MCTESISDGYNVATQSPFSSFFLSFFLHLKDSNMKLYMKVQKIGQSVIDHCFLLNMSMNRENSGFIFGTGCRMCENEDVCRLRKTYP